MNAQVIVFVLGKLFGLYFMVYPIVYFGYNYIVESVGFPQYAIPGFWLGMLALVLIMLVKNTIFSRSK